MADRREQVETKLAHADAIGRAGMIRALECTDHLQRSVVAAFRSGGQVEPLIERCAEELRDDLVDVMVTGHLRGRLDVFTDAAKVMREKPRRSRLDRLSDVIEFLERRLELTEDDLRQLRRIYGEQAALISDRFSASVTQRMLEEIAESVRNGEHVREGVDRLRRAFDELGVTTMRRHQVEAIHRTYSHMSYQAGGYNADRDPAVDQILWGYEYATVGDDRVRPTHAALDGAKLPKDHVLWRRIKPPNGWNCRCSLLRIFDSSDTLVSPPLFTQDDGGNDVRVQPDDGFDFDPGDLFRDIFAASERGRIAASREDYAWLTPRMRVVAAAIDLEEETGDRPFQKDVARRLRLSTSTVGEHVIALDHLIEHAPGSHRIGATDEARERIERLRSARKPDSHRNVCTCP